MFFNILKRDLRRKKTMNTIIFIFIVLCTTFMASSVNNLITITSAIEYFGDKTNITDYFILSVKNPQIDAWINHNVHVQDSEINPCIMITPDSIKLANDNYKIRSTTAISTLPKKYNKVLDNQNDPITHIENGDIILSYSEAQYQNINIGDHITISLGTREKTLTVSHIIKDMVFGSDYMGFNRFMISDNDYDFFNASDEVAICNFYSIKSDNVDALRRDFNNQSFNVISGFDRAMVRNTYILDMMIFSILIIVSVCLIIIAGVILRFTILFTLQEDYKEIGIMKAIGLKTQYIKKLYIVKYLAIALLGSLIGVLASIPFSNIMMKDLKHNIAMETSSGNTGVNIICACLIVLLVIGFCYLSARKVNKFTALQAIRNGSTGERFKSKGYMKLNKCHKISTVFYISVNDILSNIRSYSVLIITFMLGTLLLILPTNSAATLNNDDVINLFGIAKSDVYIDNNRGYYYTLKGDINIVLEDLKQIKQNYEDHNISINLHEEYNFNAKVFKNDPLDSISIFAMQSKTMDASNYDFYTDGTPPKLKNEIAMTTISMDKIGAVIGDTVHITIGDETAPYIITASYQSMKMMGEEMRFASAAETDFKDSAGIYVIQGDFTDKEHISDQIASLKEVTPSYTIKTTNEYLATNLGGIRKSLNSLISLLLIIVILIEALITVLLARTFLAKDIGEIALLKNIGFTNRSIRLWQILRIGIVVFIAIILGVLVSIPLNPLVAKLSFGLMGAPDTKIAAAVFESYFLYPFILFVSTTIAAILSTSKVSSIHLRDINNME